MVGGKKGHAPRTRTLLAVAMAGLLVMSSGLGAAAPLLVVDDVIEVGTVDRDNRDISGSGAFEGGPGSHYEADESETCVLPLFGNCLFVFEEEEEEASVHTQNASWYYYDYADDGTTGAYANVLGGAVFMRAAGGPREAAWGQNAFANRTDSDYEYYANNLGYSEEHYEAEHEVSQAWEAHERSVTEVGVDAVVDAPVVGGDLEVRRSEGSSSDETYAFHEESEEEAHRYFGIPIYEAGDHELSESATQAERTWHETLVAGNVFLVNPIDASHVEVIGLAVSKGEEEGSSSALSHEEDESYTRVFGFSVFETESSEDEAHYYTFFQQWLRVTVDVLNGTATGSVAYERSIVDTYDYEHSDSETSVIGIPVWGTEEADESASHTEDRRFTFDVNALAGTARASAAHWETDGTAYEEYENFVTPLGLPVGTEGHEESAFHSDGWSIDLAVAGGVLSLAAGYENRTEYSESRDEFVLGGPIAGLEQEEYERSRTLGAAASSPATGAGAYAGYSETESDDETDVLLFGHRFVGFEREKEETEYAAGAAAPLGVFTFHLSYITGRSDSAIHIAGFPIGIEDEYQEFETGVGGAVNAPEVGTIVAYRFEHEEKSHDYQLYAGGTDIGGLRHNSSHNAINLLVLNGLIDVDVERTFTDTHLYAGDDFEVLDFSGQRASGDVDAGPADVSANVFFGYLEFVDAIALGLLVATWCVDPGLIEGEDVTDLVLDAVPSTDADPAIAVARVAVALALLATCGLPVIAPVPFFLLSPCILIPVAHFLVFTVVGPLAVLALPNNVGGVVDVRDLADFAVDESGDVTWDAYDDLVGCVWLTLPNEARNPQPALLAGGTAHGTVQPHLQGAFMTYDAARRDAYGVLDAVFDADHAVPNPLDQLANAPPACPDGATDVLCATAPASCNAAAVRVTLRQDIVVTDDVESLLGFAFADANVGPASMFNATAAHGVDGDPVVVHGASARCAASASPYDSACAQTDVSDVTVDLTSLGVDLTVTAGGVRATACATSAAQGSHVVDVAHADVTVAGTPIALAQAAPGTTLLLGNLGFVTFNETHEAIVNDCARRHGDVLRVVAYDPVDPFAPPVATIEIGASSTVACKAPPALSTPLGGAPLLAEITPGDAVTHTLTVTGPGPTPTGAVDFFLCGPAAVTPGGCPAGGDRVGGTKALSDGAATSDATTQTMQVGRYCFRAVYSGDAFYEGAVYTDADASCRSAVPQPLAGFTVSVDDPTAPREPGDFVRGVATLAGGAGQPRPSGAVAFYLCAPSDVTPGVGCAAPAGALVDAAAPVNVTARAVSDASGATGAAGVFCFRAAFPGDAFYVPATTTNTGDACFSTERVTPAAALVAAPNGAGLAPGVPVAATVTVTGPAGLATPTGDVTFYHCTPSDVPVGAGCEAPFGALVGSSGLDGAGAAASPTTLDTHAPGRHCFRAAYAGDPLYRARVTTNALAACFTIEKLPPAATLAVAPSGTGVVPGAPATLTFTAPALPGAAIPTGDVTFTHCRPSGGTITSGCVAPAGVTLGTVALDGAGVATFGVLDTLPIGTHCFRAAFSGDGAYAATVVDGAAACFTVTQQTASVAVVPTPVGADTVPGLFADATATVTGAGPVPTGRVQFFLCRPGNVTPGAGCVAPDGFQVGEAKDLAAGVATSNRTGLTLDIGQHCWRAVFSGDTYYAGATVTNAASMCFTTVKQPAIITAQSNPNGREVLPGTSVRHEANVTGLDRQPLATGDVTFYLCDESELTVDEGCLAPAGTVIGSPAEIATLVAQSDSTSAGPDFGRYCWRAAYEGDGFFLPTVYTDDAASCFTVEKRTPELETQAHPGGNIALDQDVDAFGLLFGGTIDAPTPTGTVTFHLCQPWDVTPQVGCELPNGTQIGAPKPVDGATSRATSDLVPRFADGFGAALAADAGRVLVGAPEGDALADDAGAAYLIDSATGRVLQSFDNPAADAGDRFGDAVALTGDHVFIAAPFDDTNGTDAGAVYQFSAATGTLLRTLFDVNGTSDGDRFGSALGLVGSEIVVGAPFDDGLAPDAGAAYRFDVATGVFLGTLFQRDAVSSAEFGAAVAGAGSRFVVGAPSQNGLGSVHVFGAAGAWERELDPGRSGGDRFGAALAASGSDVLVGAPGNDTSAPNAGIVFRMNAASGALQGNVTSPGAEASGGFGEAVAFTAGGFLVGAPREDGTALDAGRAHRFSSTGSFVRSFTNETTTASAFFGAAVATTGASVFIGAPAFDTGATIGAVYEHDDAAGDLLRTHVALVKGFYCFRTAYSGDALFHPVTHTDFGPACFRPSRDPGPIEPVLLAFTQPGGDVPAGAAVRGLVDVDPDFEDSGPQAAGTVSWFLCGPTNMTPGVGCEQPFGTPVGEAVDFVGGHAISVWTADTDAFGRYCFRAEYSGDAFYLPVNLTDDGDDCFIAKATPPVTVAATGDAEIPAGSTPGATVTVEPVAPLTAPTGDVTFRVCRPADADAGGCPAETGDRVGAPVTLDGSGAATVPAVPVFGARLGAAVAATTDGALVIGAPEAGVTYLVDASDRAVVTSLARAGDFGAAVTALGADAVAAAPATQDVVRFDAAGAVLATYPAPGGASAFGRALSTANGAVVVGADDAVFVFDAAGALTDTLNDPAGGGTDFGAAVAGAPDAARVAVGAPAAAGGAGAAFVFDVAAATHIALSAPDATPDDAFGTAVAFMGDVVAVGAPGRDAGAGTAFLFNASTGALVATLTGPLTEAGDAFGGVIGAVGANGVGVAATGLNTPGAAGSGGLHVFDAAGTFTKTLLHPDPASGARFGAAVAATPDGAFVVGAPDHDTFVTPPGAAYVLRGLESIVGDDDESDGTGDIDNGTADSLLGTVQNLQTGRHCFRADYSGDAAYLPVGGSNGGAACVTIKLTPALALTASAAGRSLVPGTPVTATVIATGAPARATPSGDVTFFLCGPAEVTASGCPDGAGVAVGDGTALGGATGAAASVPTALTLDVGDYCFRVTFDGDGLYLPGATTNAADACFRTVRQAATLTVVSQAGASSAPWDAVTAAATATGAGPTPTGAVDFFTCTPAQVQPGVGCVAPAGTFIGTAALAAGRGVAPPTSGVRAAGTHCWRAEYAGDGSYLAATATNAASACWLISKQPVTLEHATTPGGTGIAPWAPVTDTVTVTGAGPVAPSGAATFFVCGPSEVTPGKGCVAPAGSPLGGAVSVTSGVATSEPNAALLAVGEHCVRVAYAGDAYHLPATRAGIGAACFTTTRQTPAVAVTTDAPSEGAPPWVPVTGRATVTGGGPTPTGTVRFALCGPAETATGCPFPTGDVIAGAASLVNGAVAGPGITSRPEGTYCLRAEYDGDTYYLPGTGTDATNACFVVVQACPHFADGRFGAAVASAAGAILIGVPFDDAYAPRAGVACLFDAETGAFVRSFLNPQAGAGDNFGAAVAVSADGSRVVVGAPHALHTASPNAGGAHLFDAATGAYLATITNPTPSDGDDFGAAVAFLGADVIVGAPGDDAGATDAGAVHRFDGTGAFVATVLNPGPGDGDAFGASVTTLAGDLVIGTPGDDTTATDAGAVYRFDGASHAFVRAYHRYTEDAALGTAVAAFDGHLLVGAPGDTGGAQEAGAAYLFDGARDAPVAEPDDPMDPEVFLSYVGTGSNDVLLLLHDPSPAAGSRFGATVAAVGDRLAVGAPNKTVGAADGAGAVVVFENASATAAACPVPDVPCVVAPLAAVSDVVTAPAPAAGDAFGAGLAGAAVTGGARLVVGAPLADVVSADGGVVWAYPTAGGAPDRLQGVAP